MGEIIKQSFNLYNTVGLVDKDKNIYFVPHQADIYAKVTAQRTKVFDCYYALFNEVSPFSSKYHNIEISQWSPEDRALKIEGLIDDFRQSRGQGLALNYLIMKREKYEVEGETETLTNTYYYAMFIDSVEQVGSRSVKLNLSPDVFTNFFYLNNEDILTSTYDPFNPTMKNCFIERQHYDRVETYLQSGIPRTRLINLDKILRNKESFSYLKQFRKERYFLPIGVNITFSRYRDLYLTLRDNITTLAEFKSFISSITRDEQTIVYQLFISYLNVIFKEDILAPITLRIDNKTAFYKAGFNKYKGVVLPYTHAVIPFVSIPDGFENIKPEWFRLVISLYDYDDTDLTGIHIFSAEDSSSPERILNYLTNRGASQYVLTSFVSKYSPMQNKFRGFAIEPDSIFIEYGINIRAGYSPRYIDGEFSNYKLTKANETQTLSDTVLALLPFTYTVTDSETANVKEVCATNPCCYWDTVQQTARLNVPLFVKNQSTHSWELNTNVRPYVVGQIGYASSLDEQPIGDNDLRYLVFVLGESDIAEFDLQIDLDSMLSDATYFVDVVSSYYEPILFAEPYSYYSLSIYQTEQVVSFVKMMNNRVNNIATVSLLPILSYNDSYKVGILPSYKVSDYQVRGATRCYTDSLIHICSAEVPLKVDSWIEYYITNKAQMKNQYAVQHNNFVSGFTQGIVGGAGDVISGLFAREYKRKEEMIKGTIGGTARLINIAVDNKFQKDNIALSQSARMSDMGAKPDTIKFAGSDILYDLIQNERGFYINLYTIDKESYESIAKYLERFGYKIEIYDDLHIFDRVGFNFIKLTSFDFVEDNFVLSQEQMDAISNIFEIGVTLLHNKEYLHNLGKYISGVGSFHNYELILQEIGGD